MDDDGIGDAAYRRDGSFDQVAAGRGEHHDRHVVGCDVGVGDEADEVEVGLRSRGISDLDLLVAHPNHQLEEPSLTWWVHRLGEGLVAVPQVDRYPEWGVGEATGRPHALGEGDLDTGVDVGVAVRRHLGMALPVPGRCMLGHRAGG